MVIAHADWSAHPRKRWMAVARGSDDALEVSRPCEVGPPATLLQRLAARGDGPLVIGFDFPLGVPLAYAERAGVKSFRELLARAGKGELARFFEPAETPDEISIARPFYPRRPGGTRRRQLVDALGLTGFEELLRRCDRATSGRGAAAALFWTLGGQQVGRAAISGWRDVLQPALADPETDIALWPFDGEFDALITDHRIVVAETYPREAALQVGLGAPGGSWSKRSQRDRAGKAPQLLRYAERVGLTIDPALRGDLEDGFGAGATGEDKFDATLGLLLIAGVLAGRCPPCTPPPGEIRCIEGWILGQTYPSTGEVG